MTKRDIKVSAVTVAVCAIVAGVIVLNMLTAHASFAKGQAAGFAQAKTLLNK